MEPTVFVVDDNNSICQALEWLFSSINLNVKTFNCPLLFLKEYNPMKRGCIVIDVRMPGMSGLELVERLKALHNRLPIIVITGHGDIPMAVRAMKAGAIDFISKPFNDQYLLEQIQYAIKKNVADCMTDSCENISGKISSLTYRERQIFDLIIQGQLNKQIAIKLNIAMSTVELHRARVMKKMQVKTLAQLVKIHANIEINNVVK
jgi:two-component system response regulator FixJ